MQPDDEPYWGVNFTAFTLEIQISGLGCDTKPLICINKNNAVPYASSFNIAPPISAQETFLVPVFPSE